jgi:hypothetical protein
LTTSIIGLIKYEEAMKFGLIAAVEEKNYEVSCISLWHRLLRRTLVQLEP